MALKVLAPLSKETRIPTVRPNKENELLRKNYIWKITVSQSEPNSFLNYWLHLGWLAKHHWPGKSQRLCSRWVSNGWGTLIFAGILLV